MQVRGGRWSAADNPVAPARRRRRPDRARRRYDIMIQAPEYYLPRGHLFWIRTAVPALTIRSVADTLYYISNTNSRPRDTPKSTDGYTILFKINNNKKVAGLRTDVVLVYTYIYVIHAFYTGCPMTIYTLYGNVSCLKKNISSVITKIITFRFFFIHIYLTYKAIKIIIFNFLYCV